MVGQSSVARSPESERSGNVNVFVAEWWTEAQSVAAGDVLSRAPRLRSLLLFLSEKTVTGEHDQLTEFEIGRQIFQRGEHWVPADDSIVRSSIRQLRLKLAEHYARERSRGNWILEVPRGSYVIRFRRRAETELDQAPAAGEAAPRTARSQGILIWLLASTLVVSLAVNVWFARRSPASAARPMGLAAALTMQSSGPTRVVLDDFAHVLFSQMTGQWSRSVEDYANRRYMDPPAVLSPDSRQIGVWNLLTTRHIVSLGAVATLDRLLRSTPEPSRLVTVHARNMTAREFRHGNSIVVGSRPNNPWSDMFDPELNFRREGLADGQVAFRNQGPRPGEETLYVSGQDASINSGTGYARIAYLSNHSGGFVLLLNGMNMVTTEAAGEFVTDPERLRELCRLFGVSKPKDLPHLEILLRTTAMDNSVRGASVVAWRRLD